MTAGRAGPSAASVSFKYNQGRRCLSPALFLHQDYVDSHKSQHTERHERGVRSGRDAGVARAERAATEARAPPPRPAAPSLLHMAPAQITLRAAYVRAAHDATHWRPTDNFGRSVQTFKLNMPDIIWDNTHKLRQAARYQRKNPAWSRKWMWKCLLE